ncbi:hypothetical protein D3C85_1279360 [compost metagenome]
MPSTPIALTESKNLATRSGLASLNSVQLMFTRKPRSLAMRMASTQRSYTPSWLTEWSCISRSPSRWIDHTKYGLGSYWSIFFSSSSALVHR